MGGSILWYCLETLGGLAGGHRSLRKVLKVQMTSALFPSLLPSYNEVSKTVICSYGHALPDHRHRINGQELNHL